MEQSFCVVARHKDERVRIMICDDFLSACAAQLGQLIGIPASDARQMLTKEDVEKTKNAIVKTGKDRISNEDTEVYIFYIPRWESQNVS